MLRVQLFLLLIISLHSEDAVCQHDSIFRKIEFLADFRFRVEHDRPSVDQDGIKYEERTRLRTKVRIGLTFIPAGNFRFGTSIRTGYSGNPQDPHITLGDLDLKSGNLPIGIDRAYGEYKNKYIRAWVGKNIFPFEKQNELFWSDNVNPEGVFVSARQSFNSSYTQALELKAAHFIYGTLGGISVDQSIDGLQVVCRMGEDRILLYPAIYYFHKLPAVPDGLSSDKFNFLIAHLGGKMYFWNKPKLAFQFDLYRNFSDLSNQSFIPEVFHNQKDGLVAALIAGKSEVKGDWIVKLYYTYLEKYAAVDYLAQNDWIRWSYNKSKIQAGNLTNFQGVEIQAGYMFSDNLLMKFRYFHTRQLISTNAVSGFGERIRLDCDFSF